MHGTQQQAEGLFFPLAGIAFDAHSSAAISFGEVIVHNITKGPKQVVNL